MSKRLTTPLAMLCGIVTLGALALLHSLLIGFLSGAVGMLAFGLLADTCVDWYQISSREGNSGYFVAGLALAGALLGLVIGVLCALKWAGSGFGASFFKAMGISVGTVLVLAGLAALLCRWQADLPPTIDGNRLLLEIELRLPSGDSVEALQGDSFLKLLTLEDRDIRRSEAGALNFDAAKQMDGRWIVAGEAPLSGERGQRLLDLQIGDRYTQGFLLPLPARPGNAFATWSGWLPKGTAEQPWPDSKLSYRFRIKQIIPPPAESEQ